MNTDSPGTVWRKSSRSDTGASTCVEIADLDTAVAVRDSTDPHGPRLTFTPGEWRAFTSDVKTGVYGL